MRKIKTPVTGVSMFRLLYELRHFDLSWRYNPTIETLLDFVYDCYDLFLTFDGKLDTIDCDAIDYENVTWSEFKAIVERTVYDERKNI